MLSTIACYIFEEARNVYRKEKSHFWAELSSQNIAKFCKNIANYRKFQQILERSEIAKIPPLALGLGQKTTQVPKKSGILSTQCFHDWHL